MNCPLDLCHILGYGELEYLIHATPDNPWVLNEIFDDGLKPGGSKSGDSGKISVYFSVRPQDTKHEPAPVTAKNPDYTYREPTWCSRMTVAKKVGLVRASYPYEEPILITVDARRAQDQGLVFYQTDSNAILVDRKNPPSCLVNAVNRYSGVIKNYNPHYQPYQPITKAAPKGTAPIAATKVTAPTPKPAPKAAAPPVPVVPVAAPVPPPPAKMKEPEISPISTTSKAFAEHGKHDKFDETETHIRSFDESERYANPDQKKHAYALHVLGLLTKAKSGPTDDQEVRRAYRTLQRIVHPDKNPAIHDRATELGQILNQAFNDAQTYVSKMKEAAQHAATAAAWSTTGPTSSVVGASSSSSQPKTWGPPGSRASPQVYAPTGGPPRSTASGFVHKANWPQTTA